MKDISKLSDAELDALLSEEQPKSSIGRTIGQGIAGIPAGVASIADLPAALFNLGSWGAEKVGHALGAPKETKTARIPYYGHDIATGITNALVGAPKNNQEEIARTVGNIGGAFINPSSLVSKVGQRASSSVAPAEKLATFKEAGITPTIGEISNSRPLQIAEQGLKRTPGSANVYEKAANRRTQELENLFSEHGQIEKAIPIAEGGELIKKGAKAYNNKAKDIANKLYDRAWSNIDSKARVPLNKTLEVIDESLTAITPQAREILQSSTSGKALIQLENAIKSNNGSLPLADLKKVYRREIDDLIDSWGQVGTKEQGVLKNIRNALDQETKEFVIANNPKAASDFKKADKFWSDFSERNRKVANRLSAKESPVLAFNESFSALKKGDAAKARVIQQRLSKEDQGILSSTYMNELGRGNNGQFNPDKWAREYTKLGSDSKKILTSGLPKESSKKLDSIAKALEHGKLNAAQANHSGTAYTGLLLGTGAGLLHSPIKTIGSLAGAFGLSKAFTNPKIIDGLYATSKARTPSQLDKVLSKYKKVLPSVAAINAEKEEIKERNQTETSVQNLSDEELDQLLNQ